MLTADTVRDISPDYFTLKELVGLHPDFLFADWNYGLQAGTSLTPQGLAQFGITALTESCVHVRKGTTTASISDTYWTADLLTAIGQAKMAFAEAVPAADRYSRMTLTGSSASDAGSSRPSRCTRQPM